MCGTYSVSNLGKSVKNDIYWKIIKYSHASDFNTKLLHALPELDFFDYFALHCRCVWSDQFTFGAI